MAHPWSSLALACLVDSSCLLLALLDMAGTRIALKGFNLMCVCLVLADTTHRQALAVHLSMNKEVVTNKTYTTLLFALGGKPPSLIYTFSSVSLSED